MMSIGFLFWLLMILWLVFGFWTTGFGNFKAFGGNLLLFILLALVGWKLFGAPING